MKNIIFCIVIIALALMPGNLFAGVEPSPFEPGDAINNLELLKKTLSESEVSIKQIDEIIMLIDSLDKIDESTQKALNIVGITSYALKDMEKTIDTPFYKLPKVRERGVKIMSDLSHYMFTPQPEPPGDDFLNQEISILDKLSTRMFTPQPEPPGISNVASVLNIFNSTTNIIDIMSTMEIPVQK